MRKGNTFGLSVALHTADWGNDNGILDVYWLAEHEAECDEDGESGEGWYYGAGSPGCLFDCGPDGPYPSKKAAYESARHLYEHLPHWRTLQRKRYV